jgi:hypothetical protein
VTGPSGGHSRDTSTATGVTWVETISTVLLAVAAVASAWSGYQASRWNGEQAKAFGEANASRIESTRASNLANSQTGIDVATFAQWVDAYARNETQLANFYRERFRGEFRPAVEAWIATEPLKDPDAPLTPFEMPEYRLEAAAEAERLEQAAEAATTEGRINIQHAANYVLGVVLFAVSLFFAGISTKLTRLRARAAILVIGCLILLATVGWIATFPISLSV